MDFSIVMPVFDREDFTRKCLSTLRPTLAGAGAGEIIVVDNGSRAETAATLAEFPWVRVIRNETNRGFAAACNQGARAATGRVICHLNNDIVAQQGWLAKMTARLDASVGIVGAQLFFPDDTIQHAGVVMGPTRFGYEGFRAYHIYERWPRSTPAAQLPADFEIVTGACLLTPRELFLELGGFDEIYWNGYEDVDYCLRVRERGLRVVYEPQATLYHFDPHSSVQRKRRMSHNQRTLGARFATRVEPDHNRFWPRNGRVYREGFHENIRGMVACQLPAVTLVIHGPAPAQPAAFLARALDVGIPVAEIVWLAAGPPPPPHAALRSVAGEPVAAVREVLAGRSDRYLAFVNAAGDLRPRWLDEFVHVIEYGSEIVAATVIDEDVTAAEPLAADARATLLNVRDVPMHVRIGDVATVDAALVDFTWQAVQAGLGVRAVRRPVAVLAPAVEDAAFAGRHGLAHDELRRPDRARLEAACADRPLGETLASIVMLSWNAPEYTQWAVESIHEFTRSPYEIIIIDNGSRPETLAVLATLTNVTIIYNEKNMGFAHGCNQGIAAARGTHVVLLNNDVVVTEGWLENLLDAHRRDPLVGISAPRTNRIVGHQQIASPYNSLDTMHAYAAKLRQENAGNHYRTNRAIGFCLCISRAVIDEVGGIDTRYGVGNFEDDDYCIRVRAAGYQIVVCEDVFIHHFGSVSFKANEVDYSSQMQKNWQIFAARWDLPTVYPANGYDSSGPIRRGFVRARDYFAPGAPAEPAAVVAPVALADVPAERREYALAFVAIVDGEPAWSQVGPVVSNYIKALRAEDAVVFTIGVCGDADAATIGARVARFAERLAVDPERIADVEVVDIELAQIDAWLAEIPAPTRWRVAKDPRLDALELAADRSPSGLARTVRGGK